jgi:integrase
MAHDMAKITNRLNAAKLRALTRPGSYPDGNGLYLQVRSAERRSWLFRYQLNGKAHLMGLGTFADVPLAEARNAAAAARALARQGQDPIAQRQAVRSAKAAKAAGLTFAEVAEKFIAAKQGGWRNATHRTQWRNTLNTYVMPIIGTLPVAQITTADVTRVLEPIWSKVPETASRVRGRIEAIIDYASTMQWRMGENPARWRGHLANVLPPRVKVRRIEHHAALPWREVGAFMEELAGQDGTAALALRFAILTAARSGEVIGARWREMNQTTATWTVPADRMKAGREHRVPLSDAALDILTTVARLGDEPDEFAFPGLKPRKPLSNMSMLMLLRRMGRADLTAHGFRSTFRDWCSEIARCPREVAEAALAHVVGSKAEAAYARADLLERRRPLMRDWAAFCGRPLAPADVVPIRANR